ncbi:MAG: N-acetylmuramoyl-L-alanine amidase [Thiotrichaceae bacterium]|nr:N-acetylmuramoyl-L-alanine amidase [Thiotrichaceae bacterium]
MFLSSQNKKYIRWFTATLCASILSVSLGFQVYADDSLLQSDVKITDKTVYFSFSKPVKYRTFALKSPHRIVLDVLETKGKFNLVGQQPKFLKSVRHAQHNGNLRIVFDVTQEIEPQVTLRGRNLVLLLNPEKAKPAVKQVVKVVPKPEKPVVKVAPKPAKAVKRRVPVQLQRRRVRRNSNFVIAIDAGHGGRDSGAVGSKGTLEKTVVLQIAKRLKRLLDKAPNMRGVLIRSGDYYIPLRERMEIARQKKADLFISIHADANPNKHLKGSSVFILSEKGASSEAARWLASNENRYENKLGNIKLSNKDSVSTMLMGLSQDATIDNSLSLAKNILSELRQVTKLLRNRVESAAFVVLKSPDIPSILIETAFISNPYEERRLRTSYYQNKLAGAIYKGIFRFKRSQIAGHNMPVVALNNYFVINTHTVKSGDSISGIARRYGVSQRNLSNRNKVYKNHIRIGQKLKIPSS